MGYRFRAGEGGALVLQVLVEVPAGYPRTPYETTAKWRDATVEDLPVNDPFRRDPPDTEGRVTYSMPDGVWGRGE